VTGERAVFGTRLAACRRSAGLTQQELADRSGLSVRAISNLELGRARSPHPGTVLRLADALGLDGDSRAGFLAAAQRRLGGHAADRVPANRPAPVGGALVRQDGSPVVADRSQVPAVVPRQLPAAVPYFTGRVRELAALDAVPDAAGPGRAAVVAVDGPPGAGKTALALHWAYQVADQFPDGQLFVNLRGFDPSQAPLPPTAALRGLLETLGVPHERLPRSADGLTGLYRSLLAGHRILVVLDNARDAAQVRPLLPGSPACQVVVTSRSRLTGLIARDGAARVAVDAMTGAEARELLARRLGADRVADDERAAWQIADRCGGLPLALCIAAARAAMRPDLPLAQVAADLAEVRGKLDALAAPGDCEADIRAAFSWSYRTLTPASRQMFRLLGLHPGPDVSAEAAASLAGVPPGQAARLLSELTESSLLSAGRGRHGMHDLIRAYAAELAAAHDSDADRQAATRRMLDHYLTTAATAAQLLDATRLPTQTPPPAAGVLPEELTTSAHALDWFDREYPVLLRLVDLAATAGFDVHAWQLPRALRLLFDWRAQWEDWEHTHRIAAQAATRLGDLRAQALTHLAWSRCDLYRNRWTHAEQHLHRAYDLFGELADRPGQARVLVNLGVAASAAGRYQHATAWAQRAHALCTDLGDLDGQAGTLANQGLYQYRLGALSPARDLLARARDMFTALGDRQGQALAANNLGLTCQGLGDYRQAIACHQAAVDLLAELGDLAHQAEFLNDLADAYHADSQQAMAINAREQALAILTELHHPDTATTRAKLTELQTGTVRGTLPVGARTSPPCGCRLFIRAILEKSQLTAQGQVLAPHRTSRTRSPAVTNCWASRYPCPGHPRPPRSAAARPRPGQQLLRLVDAITGTHTVRQGSRESQVDGAKPQPGPGSGFARDKVATRPDGKAVGAW
jgi:transcriptional regulator with XRE-family HTH domain/tetratricopeptide (TPR) repeat protein